MKAAFSRLNNLKCVNHLFYNVFGKLANEVPEMLDMVDSCSKLAKKIKKSGQNSSLKSTLKDY